LEFEVSDKELSRVIEVTELKAKTKDVSSVTEVPPVDGLKSFVIDKQLLVESDDIMNPCLLL
jgi:hypothetical protein